eukprot:SRR837773.6915.p1 GENE.SRR837773.6915~~SRR837773.6915.p1  ORF type:complete len:419 (+),score=194.40 SRR837773.6915:94-1257(+)
MKQDAERMRELFLEFDADNSGEVDALEMADLMRELGYTSSLEDIRVFVQQVDTSGNNALDMPEFMRLMRLHREHELSAISKAFVRLCGDERGCIAGNAVRIALEEFGYPVPTNIAKDRVPYDFDAFVGLVDECRAEFVKAEKKKAGFTDAKIEHFKQLFNELDRDRSGEIDSQELMGLLQRFHWEPKTREEQQALMKKIDLARAKTRLAGVPNVLPDGSPVITFWTFVQLARILETEHEHAEEQRMACLMEKLNFCQREVEEFRVIYVDKKKAIADEGGGENMPDGLPRQTIRRLLFLIGIEVKGDKRVKLEEELDRLGCKDEVNPYVALLEYNNKEGFIPLNEISKRRHTRRSCHRSSSPRRRRSPRRPGTRPRKISRAGGRSSCH